MKKIYTKNAPEPIGPYSQGIEHNGLLYLSGQIALDPESGNLINGNISEETHMVMKNIKALLDAANTSFDNVIKCSIFLSDMDSFKEVNEIYGSYFDAHFPARETVEVARLPKNVNVEISLIAAV